MTNLALRVRRKRGDRFAAPRDPAIADVENGAGEGIRTLDPNLGKVVLYP